MVRKTAAACGAGAAIGCVIVLLAGCSGGDDDSHPDKADSGTSVGGLPEIKCPDNLPPFTATSDDGLEADEIAHHTLRVRVTSADPVQPKKNAENNWKIQFMDDDGAPLDGVEIAYACAFMPPPHNHGTAPLNGVHALEKPGHFELDYLNFTMRGPWQLQLAVNRTNEPDTNDAGDDMDASTEPAEPATPVYTDCDRSRRFPGTEKAVFHFCVAD